MNVVKRDSSPYEVAAGAAFVSPVPLTAVADSRVSVRLRPYTIAFVTGLPAFVGGTALLAAFSRSGIQDGAFPLAAVGLAAAATLLVLGLRSRLSIDGDSLTVRFFGLRGTTLRLADLRSATFSMAWPSISFAITVRDRSGRKALVHANWWQHEIAVLVLLCRTLVEHRAALDRDTSRIVARTLRIPPPEATIVHRALLRRDRPW